jgi:hypothetical protein
VNLDMTHLLWAVNSLLIVGVGFFIKSWIGSVESRLEAKLDKTICEERDGHHCKEIEKLEKHKHASTGEVIFQ